MEIGQVVGTLYCTYRIEGLRHCSLQVLRVRNGKLVVATDPVGVRPGNWVFTVDGTAGRYAMGDASILTDLTIGGIIDHWAPEEAAATGCTSAAQGGVPEQDEEAEARAA
jgi:carboxysome peptide B